MRNEFKTYFSYLRQEVSGYKFYEFVEKKSHTPKIDKFLDYIETIGKDKLWDFLCFQFFRYHDMDTRFGKGVVQLGWIIGQKARDEWEKKTHQRWFRCVEWKMDNQISNPLSDNRYTPSSKYLDGLRKRYFNKEKGFLLCIDAELYDENNSICKACNFNEFCKDQ